MRCISRKDIFAEHAKQVFAAATILQFLTTYHRAHNLSRAWWSFRMHSEKEKQKATAKTTIKAHKNNNNKKKINHLYWLHFPMRCERYVPPLAYSWTLFLQFISISQATQILFASQTHFWSVRKTKCFNVSLKFACLVPLNSEGGDIATGLHKAQKHAVTKRYPRPVDWPNRVKSHKEAAFRSVLRYRVDLRQRVQRKRADIVCTLKLPPPAFLKSRIIS